jgi:drug/metabolite transporter (DMT)-like permease
MAKRACCDKNAVMWLIYALLNMFFMALVNYIDEFLTHSSSSKENCNIHERIGGVLVMSTVLCVVGLLTLCIFSETITLARPYMTLALVSAIPMVVVWAGYFYLLQLFSTHHVVPLFGLSSIWLLLIEIFAGASVSLIELSGIIVLVVGAYLLDRGAFKWAIPSKLLTLMLPVSFAWAVTVYLVKLATADEGNAVAVYFWQLLGIFMIGGLLFAFIAPYRRGFLTRIRTEKSRFIVPSLMNESCGQLAFLFSTLAIATAPLAVYYTAVGGIQSIFLIVMFWLFPLNHRNTTTVTQWLGVAFIVAGIALLEI